MRSLHRLAVIVAALFLSAVIHADEMRAGDEDLAYRSALYSYQLQDYLAAQSTLLKQDELGGAEGSHLLLLARVLIEGKHYDQAREVFARLDLDKESEEVRNWALMTQARMYYEEERCDLANAAIQQTKKLPVAQEAYGRFVRSSCLLQENLDKKQLEKAEKIIVDGIKKDMPESTYIWFSYAYYNLAVAAANLAISDEAMRLFDEALRFTGGSSESLALAQRIRLARANIMFADNRFDYAMASYQELPLRGYWQDEALLGFGWAAFKNFQIDRALEAWWQLTNLPYKSVNIYQAYLLIPYAYEQSNAFGRALEGYSKAIDQYADVLAEIDLFHEQLTVQRVHQHAVHYYLRPTDVEPLHPLLAVTYTKPDFRHAVEQVGTLTSYLERLTQLQQLLRNQQEYRKQFDAQAGQRAAWRQKQAGSVLEQFHQLSAELDRLVDSILAYEVQREGINKALVDQYVTYQQLKHKLQSGSATAKTKSRVQRLQGVLLLSVVEQSYDPELARKVHQVSQRQQVLRVRFAEYRQLTHQRFEERVSDGDIEESLVVINDTLQQVNVVLEAVLDGLLSKTRDALQEQRVMIAGYEKQARIARANLREDFYQQGGSKLWH